MNLVDLSNFFNKFVLWIPASHISLQLRVYLWGLLAMSSTREYYEYIYSNSKYFITLFILIIIKKIFWITYMVVSYDIIR